ncbi:MAG TPA: glycoside hydrolase domain-containing protein [Myxococcales bacterium]|nr:glycoside hydrolase domain-containing protein [Myxococcales bacterium]
MKSIKLIALAALLTAGSASAAQVWVAPAAQKIRPSVQPDASAPTQASLAAAQNEFEAFQIVVSGQATGVSMAFEGLSDGNGHSITGREVTLYREAIINLTRQSGGDGATGQWPDALVPDVDPIAGEKRNAFPFNVAAGQSIAVFVDIHAPAGTPAGTYTGTVHVTGGVTADVPVKLTVWDFAVPSTSTLKTAYGMAWNGPCKGHGDANCTGGDADLALRARYVQAALDNHVSIDTPYYTATINGSGQATWTSFDQYAGPFLDGTANTRLQGAKLTSAVVDGDDTWTQDNGWSTHFAGKGWSPALFAYVCDEPPLTCAWSDINPRISYAHGSSPQVQTLVTTTAQQAKANNLGNIDLLTPVINFVENKPGKTYAGNQRASYPATMWWYQSCMSFGCAGVSDALDSSGETGWPTMAIDADATRNRAMEWLSFVYNVQGELYYETTTAFFNGDAWTNQYAFGGNGDGTLFYPGTTAKIGGKTEIPVESLRLKMVRDGMEDYELLNLAKTLGAGDQALAIASGLFPKTYQATATPAAIDNARAELAALILHAMGKDVVAAPAPSADGGTDTGSGSTTCSTTACADPSAGTSTPTDAVAAASTGGGGGCSSTGGQQLWLAVPALAFFVLRRKRLNA